LAKTLRIGSAIAAIKFTPAHLVFFCSGLGMFQYQCKTLPWYAM
jgi:hypothetical protein